MRKLFFYFFILRKVFLLAIYPLFEKNGKFFEMIRLDIENFLIFQPSKLRAKRIKKGLLKKIQPQRFITSDGVKLYAWFIPPQNDMPVVLHFHGQAESILSHQDVALFCLKNGLGAFLLSYRGHYKSGGYATEKGVFSDAKAAINQLKQLGVDDDKIILWGHSLGSAVAVEAALNNNVLGLILQCPIKEIKSAAMGVYDFYCRRLKLGFLSKFAKQHILKMDTVQKMDCVNKIENVRCPILLLHSKSDKVASYSNSIELSEKNINAQLFLANSGSHWDTDWCLEKVFEFIQSLGYNELVEVNINK